MDGLTFVVEDDEDTGAMHNSHCSSCIYQLAAVISSSLLSSLRIRLYRQLTTVLGWELQMAAACGCMV
jgi:hypothetical protein